MNVKQRLYYLSPQIILTLSLYYAPVSIMHRRGPFTSTIIYSKYFSSRTVKLGSINTFEFESFAVHTTNFLKFVIVARSSSNENNEIEIYFRGLYMMQKEAEIIIRNTERYRCILNSITIANVD